MRCLCSGLDAFDHLTALSIIGQVPGFCSKSLLSSELPARKDSSGELRKI
jgi:hypothetical protein